MKNRLMLLAALALGGCAMNADNSLEQFKSQQWQLSGAAGDTFTLQVNGDRVSGKGGCNRFFGAIKSLDVQELTLGAIGATRMMCMEGDLAERESEFFRQLDQVRGYAISGQQLQLKDGAGSVLMTLDDKGPAN